METDRKTPFDPEPAPALTDLDQALIYLAAAVANLHEAAQHLRNCNADPLTEHVLKAREEIRQSWRGLQQARNIAG
jgi:hypothetical protein